MVNENPLRRLTDFGQSVWLDYIERGFVRDGGLGRMIAEDAVAGLTSNPAIFEKAIAKHDVYDDAIRTLARSGRNVGELHETLIIDDIRAAAELLAPVYRQTEGRDGFVSLEVSPHLARNTEGTYAEAVRLWSLVDRENLMIKVPGTREGIPVIQRLIADGINVNITLLFSVERYAAVAEAFLAGLEQRAGSGHSIERVSSVASFFLSRIDSLLDPKLEASSDPEIKALKGECAIACARQAYAHYESLVAAPRWAKLAARGAKPQRLLWASTGTKDPTYSDVKYVEALIGGDTITTLPPETLAAYRDHGNPTRTLGTDLPGAVTLAHVATCLQRLDISWAQVEHQLEEDGIKKFVAPHDAILTALTKQLGKLE
jgi:transaldolase